MKLQSIQNEIEFNEEILNECGDHGIQSQQMWMSNTVKLNR